MILMSKISWDDYFMTMVYLAAMRSKDGSTHVGAVVVDDLNIVRSMGYNSFVRGINDEMPDRQVRPEKYFWFEHAERNAIYNAELSLRGCRMYTNGIPCMDCARGIVQEGIKEVIVDQAWDEANEEKWQEHAEKTLEMFEEAGVKVRYWEGNLVEIYKFRRGEKF
jgi:dCMP deaminase